MVRTSMVLLTRTECMMSRRNYTCFLLIGRCELIATWAFCKIFANGIYNMDTSDSEVTSWTLRCRDPFKWHGQRNP